MRVNYHTHTYRCNHAVGTEEEYVREAIKGGVELLGFSDHSPHFFPGNYKSSIRMLPEELPDYARNVLELKKRYADEIEIHLGVEIEYYPASFPEIVPYLQDHGVEYMILGQHRCGNEENEPYNGTPTEDEQVLRRYCDQLMEGMQKGSFLYLAHPDLIYYVGANAVYERHMRRLCQEAKSCGLPLEINLLGLRENRQYPREIFWRLAAEEGCSAVLGSDAHAPERVCDPKSEEKGRALAKRYGLTLLEALPITGI